MPRPRGYNSSPLSSSSTSFSTADQPTPRSRTSPESYTTTTTAASVVANSKSFTTMPGTSASFWAQKPAKILVTKSSTDPDLVPDATQSEGNDLISKRKDFKAEGVLAAPSTPFSWSDDVEDAIEAMSTKENKLQKFLPLNTPHDHQYSEETILKLQHAVRKKNNLIREYVDSTEQKEFHIVELEKGNSSQLLRISELVAEVDEKDRRIEDLEAQLDEKLAQIHDLELAAAAQTDVPESKTPASVVDSIPTRPMSPAPAQAPVPIDTTEVKSIESVPKNDPSPTRIPAPGSLSEAFPKFLSTPTPRDSSEPLFVTSDTIKKAAPCPPPPKLRLGIDMSKYGKKPSPAGSSKLMRTRRVVDTGIVPDLKPDLDIRTMTREQREPFGNGPNITIKIGNVLLGMVPKYMFMQCSHVAFKHWKKNPDATSIQFPKDSMDIDAAKIHIKWMEELTWVNRVYSVNLAISAPDRENLQITRASRVLGLNNIYVGHFTKVYCDKIRDDTLEYDTMALIDELYFADNDPIFACLVHNLAQRRKRGMITNAEDFGKLLEGHPKLAAAIKTTVEMHSKPRKSRKGASSN